MEFKWYLNYGICVITPKAFITVVPETEYKIVLRILYKEYKLWTVLDKIKCFIFGQLSMMRVKRYSMEVIK